MTSSAVASNDDRTVRPSILAVWALMTDQFELGRLHHRQVRRLGSFEDASRIQSHLTIAIRPPPYTTPPPLGACGMLQCPAANRRNTKSKIRRKRPGPSRYVDSLNSKPRPKRAFL